MSSKQVRLGFETPIYLMLIGMMAIQVAKPLRINFIVSMGTWMIIISTVVAFALAIMLHKIRDRYLLNIIALTVCVCASVSASFVWEYQGVVSALSFLEIPILMASYEKSKEKNVKKTIYACYTILSVYYSVISMTSLAHVYYTEYGTRQMNFMTLGYSNPNETAMHLIVCLLVLSIMLKEVENKLARLFVIVDLLLVARLIILTLSRTAIAMMIIFAFLAVVFRKKRLPDYVRVICFLMPFAFLILTFIQRSLGFDLLFLGESIDTGRVDIYTLVFANSNWLTVLLGQYSFGFENLHNSILSIYATVGLFGVLAFIVFMYSKAREIQRESKNNAVSGIALIGVLCLILYTSTEAAFLTSGGTYAASFVSIYLLSVSDEPVLRS